MPTARQVMPRTNVYRWIYLVLLHQSRNYIQQTADIMPESPAEGQADTVESSCPTVPADSSSSQRGRREGAHLSWCGPEGIAAGGGEGLFSRADLEQVSGVTWR